MSCRIALFVLVLTTAGCSTSQFFGDVKQVFGEVMTDTRSGDAIFDGRVDSGPRETGASAPDGSPADETDDADDAPRDESPSSVSEGH